MAFEFLAQVVREISKRSATLILRQPVVELEKDNVEVDSSGANRGERNSLPKAAHRAGAEASGKQPAIRLRRRREHPLAGAKQYALRTKANPIGVAAYALQSKLPGELKGKLPTAKQLADIVRAEMEEGK